MSGIIPEDIIGAREADIPDTRPTTLPRSSSSNSSSSNSSSSETSTNDNGIIYNNSHVIAVIQLTYILGLIIWICLIVYFHLYRTNFLGLLILAIPVVAFLMGYINTCLVDRAAEREALSLSYLTVGLLVLFPIIAWFKDDEGEWRKEEAIALLIVSVMLILLSSLDFCVNRKWISLIRHIKSMMQTSAVTLIVFSLYLYFSS